MMKDVEISCCINIKNINKINYKKGDTLILSIPHEEMPNARNLIEKFYKLFPDVNVVALSDNVGINIVSNTVK